MSISPVGGPSPVASSIGASSAAKPESKDVPGAPDHDSDSDQGTQAAAVNAGRAAIVGQVNVKA